MAKSVDLYLNVDTGDLELFGGDIRVAFGDEALLRKIIFILKTTTGDFVLEPATGADLEQFIGKPNIPLIHKSIEANIRNALSNYILPQAIDVSAVPISENDVLILVEVTSEEEIDKVVQVTAQLDLRKGLVWARGGERRV